MMIIMIILQNLCVMFCCFLLTSLHVKFANLFPSMRTTNCLFVLMEKAVSSKINFSSSPALFPSKINHNTFSLSHQGYNKHKNILPVLADAKHAQYIFISNKFLYASYRSLYNCYVGSYLTFCPTLVVFCSCKQYAANNQINWLWDNVY